MLANGSLANCRRADGRGVRPGWMEADGARPSGNPRPPWVAPALSAVLIITTVDLLGNLLVILSVLRNRKIRNAGNLFLVSLVLADLVVALYPYPLIPVAIFMGEAHCKASAFVMGLSVIGSVFNITAIAVNCYCYICHSKSYHWIYQPWHMPLYICLVWLLTIVALEPNFFVASLEYDPRIYSCTFIQAASAQYTVAVVVVHFLLPITVVSFCYLLIWMLVLQTHRKAKLERSNIQSFFTMFAVFVIFAICCALLNCIGLTVAINPEETNSQIRGLFDASYFLAYFNSCLNAIVYGLLNQNILREYKRILLALSPPHCFLEASKGGHDEGLQSQAPPAIKDQHPLQADALYPGSEAHQLGQQSQEAVGADLLKG
ncbi:LOW QUALITY PROTEIN: melatonin receptor type 1B [Trichechus inunguis]